MDDVDHAVTTRSMETEMRAMDNREMRAEGGLLSLRGIIDSSRQVGWAGPSLSGLLCAELCFKFD